MKQLFVIAICCCICTCIFAQTQELEQLKINLEKLAQMRLMLSQAKQGYQILERGYNGIRDAAKGNFDLHKQKLNDLLVIRQTVRQSPSLGDFQQHRTTTSQEIAQWLQQAKHLGIFQVWELVNIEAVFKERLKEMDVLSEEVQMVLRSGSLRMSDAERLQMLENINQRSFACLLLVRETIQQQKKIAVKRAQAKQDQQAVKRLYGF
ncbi:MAG TPA: hypothetical protein DHW64_12535 [Chitinophagaceae bacterium]|nr:hypothetical protein [Chitinophagaceae bacterium]